MNLKDENCQCYACIGSAANNFRDKDLSLEFLMSKNHVPMHILKIIYIFKCLKCDAYYIGETFEGMNKRLTCHNNNASDWIKHQKICGFTNSRLNILLNCTFLSDEARVNLEGSLIYYIYSNGILRLLNKEATFVIKKD
jgi:hypothetical protein